MHCFTNCLLGGSPQKKILLKTTEIPHEFYYRFEKNQNKPITFQDFQIKLYL